MRRVNRPIALVLLLMAVLCSPVGACVVEGVAATIQDATPAHPHACCKPAGRTYLTASNGSCCAEPRTGFVHVFRFTLQKQALPASLDLAATWMPRTVLAEWVPFDRRAPLVLRI
jgi:hypothetical protein